MSRRRSPNTDEQVISEMAPNDPKNSPYQILATGEGMFLPRTYWKVFENHPIQTKSGNDPQQTRPKRHKTEEPKFTAAIAMPPTGFERQNAEDTWRFAGRMLTSC
jgi:hypothetical protein